MSFEDSLEDVEEGVFVSVAGVDFGAAVNDRFQQGRLWHG